MITGLDHVLLAMPPGGDDLAREFYGVLLGLTEVAKPKALEARGGCWFEGKQTIVHVGVDPSFTPAPKAHVAFTVSDLAGLGRRLEQAGYTILWDDAIDVNRFYAKDPFGNRLEFIQDGQGFAQVSSMY